MANQLSIAYTRFDRGVRPLLKASAACFRHRFVLSLRAPCLSPVLLFTLPCSRQLHLPIRHEEHAFLVRLCALRLEVTVFLFLDFDLAALEHGLNQ